MSWPLKVLLIGLGGAIGANARYWLGLWVASWSGTRFPWPTLSINVSGCFLLGLLTSALYHHRPPTAPDTEAMTLLLAVGGLGGYTTFSTFALEALRLWHDPSWARSLSYVCLSALGGVLAAALGVATARLLADWPR